jgi:hypothetical protein
MSQPHMQEPLRNSQVGPPASSGSANLADILERVLDKGIVIAGDVKVNLLDIELLTIKLRLLVVSVDKAKEMGIDWWERDPTLSSTTAHQSLEERAIRAERSPSELAAENSRLRDRLAALEQEVRPASSPAGPPATVESADGHPSTGQPATEPGSRQ